MNEHKHVEISTNKNLIKAFEQKEVPVGAVIVYKNLIIGKGYNQVEMLKDVMKL